MTSGRGMLPCAPSDSWWPSKARAGSRSGTPRRGTRTSSRWREVLPSSTDRNGALPRRGGCRSSRAPVPSRLLHVTRGNLLLGRKLLQRPVLLQRGDRRPERLPELGIRLAVVDPEGVGLREEVRDRELSRMLLLLIGTFRVLRQDGVRATDQELCDRVRVARIAAQVHLRLAGSLEPVVQILQIQLVLRSALDGDVLTGEVVRRLDVLRVAALDDQRAVRAHVPDGG